MQAFDLLVLVLLSVQLVLSVAVLVAVARKKNDSRK